MIITIAIKGDIIQEGLDYLYNDHLSASKIYKLYTSDICRYV